MSFLQPLLLWGLVALAVPIIVHFFYLRRSRRYLFTQTRLLERLVQASRPYLRLHHLILLALRLLIVVVVVFLFARPVWGGPSPVQTDKVSALVVVDVSPSMRDNLNGGLVFLKDVLRKASDIDECKVLSTENLYSEGDFRSVRVCLEALDQIRPADLGYPLSKVLRGLESHFAGAQRPRKRVYILSDFQASSVGDVGAVPHLEGVEYVLVPMPLDLSSNAYVDSVEVSVAGGERVLRWRLRGTEGRSYTVVPSGAPAAVVGPGWHETPWSRSQAHLKLQIQGDANDFDNTIVVGRFGEAFKSQQVYLSGSASAALERLRRLIGMPLVSQWHDSLRVAISLETLPYEGTWRTWLENGGVLVAFLPAELGLTSWKRHFLSGKVDLLGTFSPIESIRGLRPFEHELWEGVFQRKPSEGVLPGFLKISRLYQVYARDGYPLLATDAGQVLLWEIPWGRGRVYLFTFPWMTSNFSDHSLFPVFFERVYTLNMGAQRQLHSFFLGRLTTLSVAATNQSIRLRHVESGMEIVPPQRSIGGDVQMELGTYPMKAGLYEVSAGSQRVGTLGANIAPEESDSPVMPLSRWEEAGLQTQVMAPDGAHQSQIGVLFRWRSWYVWVLLALALLLLEAWWAKRLLRVPMRGTARVPSSPLQTS